MEQLSQDQAPRAEALPLVGNELALDLANTSSGRGTAKAREHLQRAEHVVLWARHAKALTPADGETLQAILAANPKLAARLLRRTLEVREVVYAIAAAIAAGHPADGAAIDQLRRIHAECVAHAKLVPHGATFVWAWDPADGPVEAVLGPITLSALTLLTQAESVAHQAMPRRSLRLALLRYDQEQEPALVRNGGLRQPGQAAPLPSPQGRPARRRLRPRIPGSIRWTPSSAIDFSLLQPLGLRVLTTGCTQIRGATKIKFMSYVRVPRTGSDASFETRASRAPQDEAKSYCHTQISSS